MKIRGKEVTLKKPTMADRIRINNIGAVEVDQKTGKLSVVNSFEKLVEYARVGLGLKDAEALNEYTDEEITEIAQAVQELINVNPTKEASSS